MSKVKSNDYKLTFWGKALSNGTQVRTVVHTSNYLATTHSLRTAWTNYSWTFTAAETAPSIRLQYPQLGTIWMDDIRVQSVSTNPPTAVTNSVTVTLTPSTSHQIMAGFGGALTWYSSWLYYGTNAKSFYQVQLQ